MNPLRQLLLLFACDNSQSGRIDTPNGFIKDGEQYYNIKAYQGNIRQVIDSGGNVVQENHYYPYGMLMAESSEIMDHNRSATVTSMFAINPYLYGGKEYLTIGGANCLDFTARIYDPVTLTFGSQDPLRDDYTSIHSQLYCAANPVMLVDPSGMIVIAASSDAQEMIKNTLPQGSHEYLQFDENGVLDANSLALYNNDSDSQNLRDMVAMATSEDYIYEVYVDDKYSYKNQDGEYSEYTMELDEPGPIETEGMYCRTGEHGAIGHTNYPGLNTEYNNSTTNNIQIFVNSKLSTAGRAQAFSHEFYGHGFLYMDSDGDRSLSGHRPCGMKETNMILYYRIENAINETVKNMKR